MNVFNDISYWKRPAGRPDKHVTGQPVTSTFHQVKMQDVILTEVNSSQLEMWANAQRDGSPAKYRWRPLFNAAKFG